MKSITMQKTTHKQTETKLVGEKVSKTKREIEELKAQLQKLISDGLNQPNEPEPSQTPKRTCNYDKAAAREYIRKQQEQRKELLKTKKLKTNITQDLKKQRLQELRQKSLELVSKSIKKKPEVLHKNITLRQPVVCEPVVCKPVVCEPVVCKSVVCKPVVYEPPLPSYEEVSAAVKIQAAFRGYRQRKRYHRLLKKRTVSVQTNNPVWLKTPTNPYNFLNAVKRKLNLCVQADACVQVEEPHSNDSDTSKNIPELSSESFGGGKRAHSSDDLYESAKRFKDESVIIASNKCEYSLRQHLELDGAAGLKQSTATLNAPLEVPNVQLVRRSSDTESESMLKSVSSHSCRVKNVEAVTSGEKAIFKNEVHTNQIHLKFEAELHLLNEFNESLQQVMAIEKSLVELHNNSATKKSFQTQDTQTSIRTKTPSTKTQVSTINYSRGCDNSTDEINSTTFLKTGIELSEINDTFDNNDNNETISPIIKETIKNTNVQAGVSLNMFEQLIKGEDAHIENLKAILKIREKSLVDRTKGELAWLEVQKKHLRDSGQLQEISTIKKKQRGLLIKLEHERHEMQRLKQMQKAASKERKLELKEQRNNMIKGQLSTGNVTKIKRSAKEYKRASGPLKVYNIRSCSESIVSEVTASRTTSMCEEVSEVQSIVSLVTAEVVARPSTHAVTKPLAETECVKQSLLMREAALQKRRKAAEELLQWHQRLVEEEEKIAQLELAAVSIITQIPIPKNSRHKFKGSQLNLLWCNMTGRREDKFKDDVDYAFSRSALQQFCNDAKRCGVVNASSSYSSDFDENSSFTSQIASGKKAGVSETSSCVSRTQERHKNSRSQSDEATNVSGKTYEGKGVKPTQRSRTGTETDTSTTDIETSKNIAPLQNKTVCDVTDGLVTTTDKTDTEANTSEWSSHLKATETLNEAVSEISNVVTKSSESEPESLPNIVSLENSQSDNQSLSNAEQIVSLENPQSNNQSQSLSNAGQNESQSIVERNDDSIHVGRNDNLTESSPNTGRIEESISETSNVLQIETSDPVETEHFSSYKDGAINSSKSDDFNINDNSSLLPVVLSDRSAVVEDIETSTSSDSNETNSVSVKLDEQSNKLEELPIESLVQIEQNTLESGVGSELDATDRSIKSITTDDIQTVSNENSVRSDKSAYIQISELLSVHTDKSNNIQLSEEFSNDNIITDKSIQISEKLLDENSACNEKSADDLLSEKMSEKVIQSDSVQISEDLSSEKNMSGDILISEKIADESSFCSEKSADKQLSEKTSEKVIQTDKSDSIQISEDLSKHTDESGDILISDKLLDENSVCSEKSADNLLSEKMSEKVIQSDKPDSLQISEDLSSEKNMHTDKSRDHLISEKISDENSVSTEKSADNLVSEKILSEKSIHTDKSECIEISEDLSSEKSIHTDKSAISEKLSDENSVCNEKSDDIIVSENSIHTDDKSVISPARESDLETEINNNNDIETISSNETNTIKIDLKNDERRQEVEDLNVTTNPDETKDGEASPVKEIDDEVQLLLKKQLEIEKEIKKIQQQQQKELPYLFVREIPNKPPPPYTPPLTTGSILPTNEKHLTSITKTAASILYTAYTNNNLSNVTLSPEYKHQTSFEFVFDLCRESAIEHYKQFDSENVPLWMQQTKQAKLAVGKPLNQVDLNRFLLGKMRQLLGYESAKKDESVRKKWSSKKRDQVDELLVVECQEEEADWVNYDKDELVVKDELCKDIMKMLINETAQVFSSILKKKTFLY